MSASSFTAARAFGPVSRRGALTMAAAAAAVPVLGRAALGAPAAGDASFIYPIRPIAVADGVWVVPGAADKITAANGGAIANVTIFDTADGAVLVDAGPSYAYGRQLEAAVRLLTGKPLARVFITHIHADHSLGASAFDPAILYGADGLAADLKARGDRMSDAMYRAVGDKMRGTNVPSSVKTASDGVEEIGGRRFRCLTLSGHTADDLCLFEETSGLLLTGDLVFLDRAATTPDADLPAWRRSLARLDAIPHAKLVPGHGPVEPGRRGIEQTGRWLDAVEGAIGSHFDAGLDEIEAMAQPLPGWTAGIAVARYEYQRSVMHLMPRIEVERLPQVG